MARTLQIKRGAKANLPTLAQGEFGFTTDTNAEELYIGNGSKNIQIARQDKVLPIEGGASNPLTGPLYFKDGQGCISAGDTGAQLYNFPDASDTTNGVWLGISNADGASKMVRVVGRVNGTETTYYLYGTNNKPTPAEIGAMPTSGGTFTGSVTHNAGTYLNASTYMKNGVFYNAYDTDGTACCILGINSTGQLTLGNSTYPHSGDTLVISPNGNTFIKAGTAIKFCNRGAATSDSTYKVLAWDTYGESCSYLTCRTNGVSHVGSSSCKWKNVYATNGTISTSDRNVKKNVEDMDDRYIQLFDLVRPVTYQFITGDRIHAGFIAQEVEEAMEKVGLTSEELGFFCKDVKVEIVQGEDGEEYQKEILDENGNPVYIYSLRYEEYIAIMAEKIRRLEANYEARLAALEAKLG